jgi:transglutaminase-like putative cysteine protease
MRLLAAATVLALFPAFGAWAREETTSYFGVYLKGTKLGSLTLTRDTDASRDGRTTVRTGSLLALTLTVLGKKSELRSETTSWADPERGRPLAVELVSVASGRATRVWATFDERTVRYRADIHGTLREGRFDLKDGEAFLPEASAALPPRPETGTKRRGKVFLPDALQLIDSEQSIEGPEPLTLGKTARLAWRLTEKSPLSPGTYFLSESGDLLSARIALGLELRREEKAVALAVSPGPAPELTRLIGVVPTGAPLLAARRLREVRYVLEGVTRPLPASDEIQQVRREGDRAHVSVATGPLPPAGSPLFSRPEDAPEPLRRFLSPTAYVNSDAPELKSQARAVLGGETDSARAAAKLSRFVHEALRPDASIPALRTAHDIHRDRRGVCRDYTTYFTALARASGLPTKQCVGLAFVDGLFVYHAWPEVYVGSGRWVALEPTWGDTFADATHLKLAEGELTDFFQVAADIGSYQIRVVSAR